VVHPLPLTDANGGIVKSNRFFLYSKGDHVPNLDMVRRAEQKYPGSAALLNHVIWNVLRTRSLEADAVRDWIGRLDPEISKAVLKPANGYRGYMRTSKMLIRRFGLDSLAALTLLFRMSLEKSPEHDDPNARYETETYLVGIFQVLVVMSAEFINDELRNRIFNIFSERIFSLVESKWLSLRNFNFADETRLFRRRISAGGMHLVYPISELQLDDVLSLIKIP
jgi:hypothetical protein